jgi:hypothetical protein
MHTAKLRVRSCQRTLRIRIRDGFLNEAVFDALRCEAAKNCKGREDFLHCRQFERQQNCSILRAVVYYTMRLFALIAWLRMGLASSSRQATAPPLRQTLPMPIVGYTRELASAPVVRGHQAAAILNGARHARVASPFPAGFGSDVADGANQVCLSI